MLVPKELDESQIMTPNQVAEMLMVSPAAVRQWAAKGQIPAMTTPGGHRRFRLQDVIEFAQGRGMSVQNHYDGLSILIVDDDLQFGNLLKEMITLHDDQIKVRLAHDGFEAGKLVQSFKPDLMFLDLRMPTMDGFETCRRLKEDPDTESIRIVCMTGFDVESDRERVLEYGAEACLKKPIEEELLFSYIEKKERV